MIADILPAGDEVVAIISDIFIVVVMAIMELSAEDPVSHHALARVTSMMCRWMRTRYLRYQIMSPQYIRKYSKTLDGGGLGPLFPPTSICWMTKQHKEGRTYMKWYTYDNITIKFLSISHLYGGGPWQMNTENREVVMIYTSIEFSNTRIDELS